MFIMSHGNQKDLILNSPVFFSILSTSNYNDLTIWRKKIFLFPYLGIMECRKNENMGVKIYQDTYKFVSSCFKYNGCQSANSNVSFKLVSKTNLSPWRWTSFSASRKGDLSQFNLICYFTTLVCVFFHYTVYTNEGMKAMIRSNKLVL